MHALIIEDEFLIAAMIEDALRELGYTSFDLVGSEAEAVAAAQTHTPDLITADDRLKYGSGPGAVRTICKGSSIPVIFIVGNPHAVEGAFEHSIVLGKPYRSHQLGDAVRAVCA